MVLTGTDYKSLIRVFFKEKKEEEEEVQQSESLCVIVFLSKSMVQSLRLLSKLVVIDEFPDPTSQKSKMPE